MMIPAMVHKPLRAFRGLGSLLRRSYSGNIGENRAEVCNFWVFFLSLWRDL